MTEESYSENEKLDAWEKAGKIPGDDPTKNRVDRSIPGPVTR